ncbi:MAG: hypothetical protein ACI9QC_000960, partial [Oceanicoccus sp.]
ASRFSALISWNCCIIGVSLDKTKGFRGLILVQKKAYPQRIDLDLFLICLE